MSRPLRCGFLGRLAYAPAERLQDRLRLGVLEQGEREALLLLEHAPVVTLGRSAHQSGILASPGWLAERGIEVAQTDRGGQVTFHGAGQLVGYPILDLRPDRRDVRRYVRDLEAVLIATLLDFGVAAEHSDAARSIGVWVGPLKIASIGVHLRRWVTTHGFALNVTTDLSYFSAIEPCGLAATAMTSLEQLTGQRPPLVEVAAACARHLAERFDRRLEALSGLLPEELDSLVAPPVSLLGRSPAPQGIGG